MRLGRPKALNKVCKKLKAKSSPPDSSPIVRAECLCSTKNCDTRVPSDPLPTILRPMCYQCTGNCTGLGDLKQCEDPSFNCFVTHDTGWWLEGSGERRGDEGGRGKEGGREEGGRKGEQRRGGGKVGGGEEGGRKGEERKGEGRGRRGGGKEGGAKEGRGESRRSRGGEGGK